VGFTPATDILHTLSKLKRFGVTTMQVEDEIAGVGAAIGASYGGAMGITTTSGPGVALKSEAIGLAVSLELPLVIVDVQRGGPSTGLPTKTEQSDLYQAIYGRNGDTPIPVIAARSPSDAFECAIEACRIATQYMTPVILLTDGYIANAAEPWLVPDPASYTPFPVKFLETKNDGDNLLPFARDERSPPRIRLAGVSLRHDPARPLLEALDLEIGSGELVVLVGLSGSGKTTLADLLIGLAEPGSGTISIDATAGRRPANSIVNRSSQWATPYSRLLSATEPPARSRLVRVLTTNERTANSPRPVVTDSSIRRRDSARTVVADSPAPSPSVTVTRWLPSGRSTANRNAVSLVQKSRRPASATRASS